MNVPIEHDQLAVRCVVMRGGSSRGLFFLKHDLPSTSELRDRLILAAFGSPDRRQIDGLGGADALTSKVAVIGRSTRPDADVDYTFGQVSITTPQVLWKGNCGNISSAVGPFAVDEGLVPVEEPITRVRIYNTNTQKIIEAEVPVHAGRAIVTGDTTIAGVPGSGAPIALNFLGSEGAVTGKLLPTGSKVDNLVTSEGTYDVSIVDAATPFVFVDARSLGCTGVETPDAIDADAPLLARLESIREAAAVRIGLVKEGDTAAVVSPSIPRVAMVSSPVDHDGGVQALQPDRASIVVRQMAMQKAHKAFSVTGSVCLGTAIALSGTIPNALQGPFANPLRIAHPQGIIEVEIQLAHDTHRLERAVVLRTARRLMDGYVYIRRQALTA